MATWKRNHTKEKFYRLEKWRCPAQGCRNTDESSWYCAKHDKPVYISQKGYIKCDWPFEEHKGLMCGWRWRCEKHGEMDYRPADLEGFTWAMSGALHLIDKAGAAWVAQLTIEVGKQFKRLGPLSDGGD